jgi:UDP-glucose:(heptosyl)LPS alpha-1,3-glucosyltransferase
MHGPLRIALVRKDYSLSRGGAENYTAALTGALIRRGHEVHLFVQNFDHNGPVDFKFHKIPVSGIHRVLRNYTFAANVERALRWQTDSYDIVNGLSKIWYQDVCRMSDPLYAHWLKVHPAGVLDRVAGFLNPRDRLQLLLERRMFDPRNFRRIVSNSGLNKRLVMKYYRVPGGKIRVIYNGVDHARFNMSVRGEAAMRVREKHGIPEDAFVLLYAAMDWKRKGLRFAIEALGLLDADARRRAMLLVVGKGDRAKYERLARRLGVADRVIWETVVSDIEFYYGAADVFVFPTRYDPFANVTLEALASGVPVITTAMNGGAEVVREGETGFILGDAGDTDALAGRIMRIISGSNGLLEPRAISDSVREYTVDANASATLALYEEVLEEKRREVRTAYYRRG